MTLLSLSLPLLALFAAWDLVVGVGNDAVNFLNPAIGSRAARPKVVLATAAAGVLAGSLFSSGMMEIARKGIFRPELFTMPELLAILAGVMVADVLLLDLFNTYGLPTSTTVSVVFELLGGAFVVALFRVRAEGAGWNALARYLNTGKALAIVSGILLSVVIAFTAATLVMYLSRLLFTFDVGPRLTRYGALFGGLAIAAIGHFILVKGIHGTSFATPALAALVESRSDAIRLGLFLLSATLLHLHRLAGGDPLRPVVLAGTFALALAFAANDLVNFIGVPLAGFAAWTAAHATADPLGATMGALNAPAASPPLILLGAGGVMLLTLVYSRKARTVVRTSVELGRQEEWVEAYDSTGLARVLVRMACALLDFLGALVPAPLARFAASRFARPRQATPAGPDAPAFDLLRATVILAVAAALISYGTAHKLPLSTTFVTFMAAMGASFADRAWGRDTAVFRVSGVFTVVGGWFATALFAFLLAGAVAALLRLSFLSLPLVVAAAAAALLRSHRRHAEREAEQSGFDRFRLPEGAAAGTTARTLLAQCAFLLRETSCLVDLAVTATAEEGLKRLRHARREIKRLERFRLLLAGNMLRAFRALGDDARTARHYGQIMMLVHEITDGARDLIHRGHIHVCNHHAALTPEQSAELRALRDGLLEVTRGASGLLEAADFSRLGEIDRDDRELEAEVKSLNERQTKRVLDDAESMRSSVLFFSLVGDMHRLARRHFKLAKRLRDAFRDVAATAPPEPAGAP